MKIRVCRQEHKPAFLSHAEAEQAWLEGETFVIMETELFNPPLTRCTDHCQSAEEGYDTVQIAIPLLAPLVLVWTEELHWHEEEEEEEEEEEYCIEDSYFFAGFGRIRNRKWRRY